MQAHDVSHEILANKASSYMDELIYIQQHAVYGTQVPLRFHAELYGVVTLAVSRQQWRKDTIC